MNGNPDKIIELLNQQKSSLQQKSTRYAQYIAEMEAQIHQIEEQIIALQLPE